MPVPMKSFLKHDFVAAQNPNRNIARLTEFRSDKIKSKSKITERIGLRRSRSDLNTACVRENQRRFHLPRFRIFHFNTDRRVADLKNANGSKNIHLRPRIFKMESANDVIVFVLPIALFKRIFRSNAQNVFFLHPRMFKKDGIHKLRITGGFSRKKTHFNRSIGMPVAGIVHFKNSDSFRSQNRRNVFLFFDGRRSRTSSNRLCGERGIIQTDSDEDDS